MLNYALEIISFMVFLLNRVKTQKNLEIPTMSVFIQLHLLGMETPLMARQPVCVFVVLCIMTLSLERRMLQRVVYAAISYATQSLETKF